MCSYLSPNTRIYPLNRILRIIVRKTHILSLSKMNDPMSNKGPMAIIILLQSVKFWFWDFLVLRRLPFFSVSESLVSEKKLCFSFECLISTINETERQTNRKNKSKDKGIIVCCWQWYWSLNLRVSIINNQVCPHKGVRDEHLHKTWEACYYGIISLG